jgi:nitrite reductase (cytochrome c-552)
MKRPFSGRSISAQRTVGFHNPTEAIRILGDATAFAGKAEGLLRQALAKAGIDVPIMVNLELHKYLDDRGKKKLMFDPDVEIKDPFGLQDRFVKAEYKK